MIKFGKYYIIIFKQYGILKTDYFFTKSQTQALMKLYKKHKDDIQIISIEYVDVIK